jgi:hypothetical protein
MDIKAFMGKPIEYWIEVQNQIETLGIENVIKRNAQLEAEVERLEEALDEISKLEPGNVDFCYEIAENALKSGE